MTLQTKRLLCLLAVVGLLITPLVRAKGQQSQLGKVEFQTSGSEKAQTLFLRGLAALHSFWYEEALDAFREATTTEPNFLMGYWGEAMAQNHPLWSEQDTTAARRVIDKIIEIGDTTKVTAREKAYLNAVKLLYGEGDKRARDEAYSAAMEKVYRDYPDDLDAAAFYSLSLLALASPQDKSYRLQARAAAIALDVYQKNPNHPGAAHYIIHAFDDPDHASLALPAARRYASIAPEAHHARHMPAHIFLQLGMWPEAVASNESAWEVSDAWMKRKHLSASVRDYHSLHWLLYCYLQQGRYSKAEELLALMKKVMSESTYDNKLRPGYYENNYANMAAVFVIETERWELAGKLFPVVKGDVLSAGEPAAAPSHSGHGAMQTTTSTAYGSITVRPGNGGQILPLFVRGFSGAMTGSTEAAKNLADLTMILHGKVPANDTMDIRELEVAALNASVKKNHARAIEWMKKATQLEEERGAPSGPPQLIKPSHELFGEILLRAGKPEEAAAQFRLALLRQPNRARSLLGAARAAEQSGDRPGAAAAYAKLLKQWQQADESLPELREARDYVKSARL